MEEIIPVFAILIPIIALLIPIVAILTHHQRKMSEMMHSRQGGQNDLQDLRREVQQLKEVVAHQAIQMDDFLSNQRKLSSPPPSPEELQSRIGG